MKNDICFNIKNVLAEEISRRDSAMEDGNFAETAMLEHLHRYWIELAIARSGYRNIKREVKYLGLAGTAPRKSCDLVAEIDGRETWVEIKVAYENSTYTREELIGDIGRLDDVPGRSNKIYAVIFLSRTSSIPEKLQTVDAEALSVGAVRFAEMQKIKVPRDWVGWSDPHLHVRCYFW